MSNWKVPRLKNQKEWADSDSLQKEKSRSNTLFIVLKTLILNKIYFNQWKGYYEKMLGRMETFFEVAEVGLEFGGTANEIVMD